jgi:hypothetical protein
MKDIVEFFAQKGIVFKSLKAILPKELNSRKRVEIYLGVDLQGYFVMVMKLEKSSRVLRKEVEGLFDLHSRLERLCDSSIKKRYIIINAPLCSKAKDMLVSNGWRVWSGV